LARVILQNKTLKIPDSKRALESSGRSILIKMSKVIYCSDLHGNKTVYKKLFEKAKDKDIKAIIIGGDICPHFRGPIEMGIKVQREFLTDYLIPRIKQFGKEVFVMMGNDDFAVNMDVLVEAEKNKILKLLHFRLHELGKFKLIGYSFVPPMPFLLKDWEKLDDENSEHITDPEMDIRTVKKEEGTIEEDFKEIKKMSNAKETIYVIHSPPFGTKLDMTLREEHVGSKAIKDFIKKEQPPLTLHGHIHEGPETGSWKDNIKNTLCINPGSSYLKSMLNIVVISIDNPKKAEYLVV